MDYDRNIHHNPDAQAWAKFFIETTKDIDREVFGIEGFMIAWFSNAMMAMHDHLYKTEIVKLRNDAANEIERLRNNQSILITSFRVNMMRLCPEYSHEEFDKDIAAMLKEKE
jgi:hypothetical protein